MWAVNSEDKNEWKKPGVKGQKLESLRIIQQKPTIKNADTMDFFIMQVKSVLVIIMPYG